MLYIFLPKPFWLKIFEKMIGKPEYILPNLDINWKYLSRNKNTINILEKNLDAKNKFKK